jgi:glycosyltransferase involved in cell wall biosynthesis
MKVLMISGDKKLLDPATEAGKRLALQRAQVEQLDAFVWPQAHSRREIIAAARKNHYDVITAQDPFWRGVLAWKIVRRTQSRLNIQIHTDLSAQPILRRLLARFVLHRADTVRVVSQKIADQLTPLHLRARISVLPVYIEVERFKALRRAPRAGSQKTLLWIGRFEEEKDPLLALDILEQVHATESDTKLVMLGAGNLGKRLRDDAKRRALPVEFPGWQDPLTFLADADVVISTSRHESYGASMIEALASGVPVVAPDVGIAREAGAIIASRAGLAEMTLETLRVGVRGVLKLNLLNAEAWAHAWRETLI